MEEQYRKFLAINKGFVCDPEQDRCYTYGFSSEKDGVDQLRVICSIGGGMYVYVSVAKWKIRSLKNNSL